MNSSPFDFRLLRLGKSVDVPCGMCADTNVVFFGGDETTFLDENRLRPERWMDGC